MIIIIIITDRVLSSFIDRVLTEFIDYMYIYEV